MSKAIVSKILADRMNMPAAEAAHAVDLVMESIQQQLLALGKVTFVGFGGFAIKTRPARRSLKIAKDEPAMPEVMFTPATQLRALVEKHYGPRPIKRSPHQG